MPVFPERMNQLSIDNVPKSLKELEDYIRYITERVEFANQNTTRTVTQAGVSTVGLYQDVMALADAMATLRSSMNIINGNVSALGGEVSAVKSDVAENALDIAVLEAALTGLEKAVQELEAAAGIVPPGTYDGNGDATERQITVGGNGGALMVYDSTGIMAIVTQYGMHYMSSTTAPLFKDTAVASFSGGVLTLKTGSYINVSGRTYTYQII